MRKILLFGREGQIGWELQRSLGSLGALCALGRAETDLTRSQDLRQVIRREKPDIIVNAAAYTEVDKAESESDLAQTINAHAVGVIADELAKLGALMVHYSTDYVFDGAKAGFYTEEDGVNPLNVYGRSKREGEMALQASGCNYLIFRTSWVYSSRRANFPSTILRIARERDTLDVVNDQIGAPTSAELIADVTAICLSRLTSEPERFASAHGTYNVVPSGEISWHGYALFLIEQAKKLGMPLKLAADAIRPISASQYRLPAKRPRNSRLSTAKLTRVFGLKPPHWHFHVERLMEQLRARQ